MDEILAPCYEVSRRRFYAAMMTVNLAHVCMLDRCAIIPRAAASGIVGALLARIATPPAAAYDPRHEDLFFQVESEITGEIGAEAAGHMHVAFSRNDLDAAMFRMALRDDLLDLAERLQAVRAQVAALAGAHLDTVMVAHTHNQQAQPTTLAHYLMAVESNLRRDTERLAGLYGRVNLSPMGAAALGTTSFPIDRPLVAGWLGFDGLVENAYDAVSAADHVLEAAATVAVMAAGLSRFVHDLMLWASNEFGVLQLDDSLVQISSIMPQKRNPVALEHLRAVLSRLLGRCAAVFPLAHNVPLGDINDVGDDLQPLVEEVFRESKRALDLTLEVLRCVHFDTGLMAARARAGFSAATELADTLVREAGLPFRQAHRVVARFVAGLREAGETLPTGSLAGLDAAARVELGRPTGLTEEACRQAVDPQVFVARRTVVGGPAPVEVRRALAVAVADVSAARQAEAGRRQKLAAARADLLAVARALAQAGGT
ncbi:MAG TPA: argininosuccinate lyase [Symbiobacteriaceae bacterium]